MKNVFKHTTLWTGSWRTVYAKKIQSACVSLHYIFTVFRLEFVLRFPRQLENLDKSKFQLGHLHFKLSRLHVHTCPNAKLFPFHSIIMRTYVRSTQEYRKSRIRSRFPWNARPHTSVFYKTKNTESILC